MGDTPLTANHQAAVRDVLARLVECWNRADGAAYGKLFTDDADYIDVTGTHTVGAEAIGRLHQYLFDGPLRGSRLESDALGASISFVAPAVALVIGGGTSRLAGQATAPAERDSINTTLLIERDGAWLIRAFQNNRVMRRQGGPQ